MTYQMTPLTAELGRRFSLVQDIESRAEFGDGYDVLQDLLVGALLHGSVIFKSTALLESPSFLSLLSPGDTPWRHECFKKLLQPRDDGMPPRVAILFYRDNSTGVKNALINQYDYWLRANQSNMSCHGMYPSDVGFKYSGAESAESNVFRFLQQAPAPHAKRIRELLAGNGANCLDDGCFTYEDPRALSETFRQMIESEFNASDQARRRRDEVLDKLEAHTLRGRGELYSLIRPDWRDARRMVHDDTMACALIGYAQLAYMRNFCEPYELSRVLTSVPMANDNDSWRSPEFSVSTDDSLARKMLAAWQSHLAFRIGPGPQMGLLDFALISRERLMTALCDLVVDDDPNAAKLRSALAKEDVEGSREAMKAICDSLAQRIIAGAQASVAETVDAWRKQAIELVDGALRHPMTWCVLSALPQDQVQFALGALASVPAALAGSAVAAPFLRSGVVSSGAKWPVVKLLSRHLVDCYKAIRSE